jgi:four helix bundle protein
MSSDAEDTPPNLRVRTKAFARRVIRLFAALPRSPVGQVLGRQLLRSGTSIGANYREASRARSKAEFIAKLGDCLKEADESEYWLELIHDEKLVKPARLRPLLEESGELVAILTKSIRTAKNRPD